MKYLVYGPTIMNDIVYADGTTDKYHMCVPNILFSLSETMTLYLLFDTIRYTSAIISSR